MQRISVRLLHAGNDFVGGASAFGKAQGERRRDHRLDDPQYLPVLLVCEHSPGRGQRRGKEGAMKSRKSEYTTAVMDYDETVDLVRFDFAPSRREFVGVLGAGLLI